MLKKLPTKGNKPNEVEYVHTLLVDGNALFKTGYHGAKNEVNRKGEHIGGVYQFLTMLRKLMNETIYHNIFVFWDGEYSGKLRYEFYPEYKSGRNKIYDGSGTMPVDDENQILERLLVQKYLEELYIKQLEDPIVESDDFIAYYVLKRQSNEKITICTNDSDICQLISEYVRIYKCDKKIYIDLVNYNETFGFDYRNAKLIKTITGDSTDSIKGVKGVGVKTLIKNFPKLQHESVKLDEIIEMATIIQEERISNKKKPISALTNIIHGISDDEKYKGKGLYEINDRLVNLQKPLLTSESIINIDSLIKNNLSDDRSIKTVIKLINEYGLIDKIGSNNLDNYLLTFKKYIERYKKSINNNNNN